MNDDKPISLPLHKEGDLVMGFHIHYPVSGIIKGMIWNIVNLEWEYFIDNDDGFDGKIKEGSILKYDIEIWNKVENRWRKYLGLMKEAADIKSECKTLLKVH